MQAEAAVEQYRAANGLSSERQIDISGQEVADVNGELVAAQADLASRQARLAFIRDRAVRVSRSILCRKR